MSALHIWESYYWFEVRTHSNGTPLRKEKVTKLLEQKSWVWVNACISLTKWDILWLLVLHKDDNAGDVLLKPRLTVTQLTTLLLVRRPEAANTVSPF